MKLSFWLQSLLIKVDESGILKCRVRVGRIFELFKLILFLKTYFVDGLAPSCQTLESLFIPHSQLCQLGKWSEHSYNEFHKLKNSKLTRTFSFKKLVSDSGKLQYHIIIKVCFCLFQKHTAVKKIIRSFTIDLFKRNI